MSEVKVSQGCGPSRVSRGGSFLPLPASGGSRRPWACGRVSPVSASVFSGLLLCVCVSPLLSLRRTLSLDVGPPSSRRTSSQTLHCITSAKTLFPNKVPLPGGHEFGAGGGGYSSTNTDSLGLAVKGGAGRESVGRGLPGPMQGLS